MSECPIRFMTDSSNEVRRLTPECRDVGGFVPPVLLDEVRAEYQRIQHLP